MEYRALGRTGWNISAIGFGAWGIGGGGWGNADDKASLAARDRAIDLGVNFIDTADVYGDGHSEQLVAQVRKARSEALIIATKAGRRLNPHVAAGYNRENLTAFVERSLRNLETEALDLLQLHCPPSEVYDRPEAFGQGETFSGVDYATGLQAVEELRSLVPKNATLAKLALRWILMFPEVTTAIPGAKTPAQAENNVQAAALPELDAATMNRVQEIYDNLIRAQVHSRW